jgi:hypothetical protein
MGLSLGAHLQAQSSDPGFGPPPSSTSTCRQFLAFSRDRDLRARTLDFAEQVKKSWLEAMALPDRWQFPILILFHETGRWRSSEPFTISFLGDGEGSNRWQIEVRDPEAAATPEMAAKLFQVLILELHAREAAPRPGRPVKLPPLWLTEGLLQNLLSRRQAPPVQLIENLVNNPRPPTALSVLRQKALPASVTEQVVFRLLAYSLLRTMLEAPGGPSKLTTLLRQNPPGEIPEDALLAAYPEWQNNWEILERNWLLTLARLNHTSRTGFLTLRETRQELGRLLAARASLPRKDGTIEELTGAAAYSAIAREQGGPRALVGRGNQLLQLELRAHPLYQPIVREYREILFELARRPKWKPGRRLERVEATRLDLDQRAQSFDEVMDWFEANQTTAPDPAFQQILRLQAEVLTSENRTDAISRSLDRYDPRRN